MNIQPDFAPPPTKVTDQVIPVIDIGPLLAQENDAINCVAEQLNIACSNIGFFFVTNHGISEDVISKSFEISKEYFSLPFEEKMKVRMNRHQCGYMPPDVAIHNDTFEIRNTALTAQHSEAFKFTFDLNQDHPDFGKNIRFRGHNKWPDSDVCPGLHEAFMGFHNSFQSLGMSLLAPLAISLDLPHNYFNKYFIDSSSMTRIAYYPPIDGKSNQVALPGHRDSSFLSFIPPATRPGLEIMTNNGEWIEQPIVNDAVLVNTGTALVEWINDRYLATPHRVRADSQEPRYSNIFFFYPNVYSLLECPETCLSPANQTKYPPFTFGDFHAGFCERNFGYSEDWN